VTIRALTFHGKGDIRCESRPDPTPPDAHGALLRVERAAICGSDLHLYHGDLPVAETGFAVGHEFVGEVVETGSAVRDFKAGDRVLCAGVIGCGLCGACRAGRVVRCERRQTRVFGMGAALPGGQAEAVAVPGADHALRRIPDGVSVEQAVLLTDILPTAFYGARGAEIRPGQTVAVIGLGPVGLLAVECAQLFGPARVLAIDRIPERLAAAEALGATPVHVDRAAEAALAATGGAGPDAVIEAVGADATIQLAIQLVRAAGGVSVVGVNLNLAFPFPMALALMKDLTFRIGICPVPELWDELVPLVQAGRIRPERVFTHRLPLSEGSEAYRIFDQKRGGVLKVMLDPAR
jgi:2-desacetyl-2-hydroxyethyl bacteriochlorophyllide A dehydrogenase